MKTLKVKKLIKLLQTQPTNLDVLLEGCDCIGEALKVSKIKYDGKQVLIIGCNSGIVDGIKRESKKNKII